MPPLVSIVLPTHNGARYLDEAVESIRGQSYDRWELVIVDDASTDDTPRLVASLVGRDRRIRAIRNAVNRKISGSLNAGFSEARGELLTWTSDDNWHRPDTIAELVGYLDAHPDVDVVYADYTHVDAHGTPIASVIVPEPTMLAFDNVVGACFLYRRAVQDRLAGYADDMFLAEDYDFWLRASCHFRLERLGKDLYGYRIHGGALGVRRADAVATAHRRALCRNLPAMTWLSRERRAMAYVELARRAFQRRDRRAAQYLLGLGLVQSPRILSAACRARWSRASLATHGASTEPLWDLVGFALGGFNGWGGRARLTGRIRSPRTGGRVRPS
jgi:glycosyltransferase involved in cell wall biosynthesis